MKIAKILAPLFLIVITSFVFAENNFPKTKKLENIQSKSVALPQIIDDEKKWGPELNNFILYERLPEKFNGNSAKPIVKWIQERIPENKDEYEKQAEYEERIKHIAKGFEGKIYAFSGDVSFYESYDAENEEFIPASRYFVEYLRLTTDTSRSDLGKYAGTNAYGVKANISQYFMQEYGVAINEEYLHKSGLFIKGTWGTRVSDSLSMPLDRAKLIGAKDIRYLFVGQIDPTLIRKLRSCTKPTIVSPNDGCVVSNYLNLKPSLIVIYNYLTGEIINKKYIQID